MSQAPPRYVVAVRALCEFTAKRGDLDLRFTPSPSAQEGMAGHALVAGRRADSYQAEVSLSSDYKQLRVRGRADGYDPGNNRLEEVKTFRGDLARLPDNHRRLHWAQVKIYGWLLCQKLGLAELRLALVYLDIGSQQETVLSEPFTADALKVYFETQCESFLHWAAQELAHRAARDAALTALAFPHPAFRPGQRELAEAVYRSGSSGRCLMAQAPTGIGKTMGTVFPLLKAAPGQALDKVFFLTAKTPGRQLALDALARIQASAPTLPLRALELVARDKACEHPDKACHGDSCPLAKGFYDRLPAARSAAISSPQASALLDKTALRHIALAHQVCPYYLSQDLVRWADVVVGDYNYYFDVSALLHGLTAANQWRVSVLVDEAHNLVERARKMYSAGLDQADLAGLRQSAPAALKKSLDRLQRSWNALHKAQSDPYQVHDHIPEKFLQALQQASSAITDELTEHPTRVDAGLQRFYFDALHFSRMADSFGAHSLFDVTLDHAQGQVKSRRALAQLCIRNVVPAPFLAPRFAAARSVALFSATLSPQNYYADTLGLPGSTVWTEVQSPFLADQLAIRVVSDVSTRYQHRDASLSPIVELMARQYRARPGNYLAFTSSYDYLQKLLLLFRARYPQIASWEQTRRMDEAAREAFLARFTAQSQGIGFAVLGGAFAEGIDLPGDRLIGAFIATLGLPQLNPINEQIRARMGSNFGADQSYDYTYLYPGVQKVVQAAGRVIRTPSDQGVIYLMDDRFARSEVKKLLPGWWQFNHLRVKTPAPATDRDRYATGSKHPEQHQQQDNADGYTE
ncbi:ATP-dependent DNA helicase [Polaromonas sp.]|uniref:ATP-dependent DNA helicase n=1 Tax=Polaromonas sp. TaxID=1869339 RepID=UPI00286D4E2B|nr:ATP-dependent DNA helicase [Polaromonas sp.]